MSEVAEKRPGAEVGATRATFEVVEARPPGAHIYAGLFLVTLATLMLEILLTRIFSVILWYHFAFVAVSVALFGMTVGAVIVHLTPRYFSGPALAGRLGGAAWLFGLTTAGALAAALTLQFRPPALRSELAPLAPLYLLVAVPFIFSGIVVSVALTRFPQRVNRLYAADLIGAAIGCTAVIFLLKFLDAPSAVIAVGAAAALGGLFFSLESRASRMRAAAAVLVVALIAFAIFNAKSKAVRPRWVKGWPASVPLYERWNAFSRIAVSPYSDAPVGWYGTNYDHSDVIKQLWLDIDAEAASVLTHFTGDLKPLRYLPYEISASAHWLRPNADVLVIGTGGGRDVLTALTMHQKSVTGVEINGDIVKAVNQRFGDFTGHLDHIPNVRFITDEARSWIDRSDQRFDIIQCSLIDTWAATAAGAFVLSENSIYTRQAWVSILKHLTDRGIFSVTRWYFYRTPGEILRCLSLARASLEQLGVRDVRRHLAVVRCLRDPEGRFVRDGVATVLVSRSPLSNDDVRRLDEYARRVGFDLVLSPTVCTKPVFEQVLSAPKLSDFTDSFYLDISPPTDDRPFFFHLLRLRDWARPRPLMEQGRFAMHLQAISVLGRLLVTSTALALLFIIAPLGISYRRGRYPLRSTAPALLFFAAIGLGFMLVEISQMQRLIIFLGHPVYGLSVVLFGLLGASGVGSLAAGAIRLDDRRGPWRIAVVMGALLALLAMFGFITPMLTEGARSWPTPQRVLLATGLLLPIAFFMGAPFPLGMKLASQTPRAPTAWYWGVNGATSVVASVAAMALALTVGISKTFFVGVGWYAAAAIFLILLSRQSWGGAPKQNREMEK